MSTTGRITVSHFRKMKEQHERIVMLTAYDAPTAAVATACGVEILLVGDSMANTMLGYRNTLPLTMEESLHHAKAVRRGAPDAFVVADMPFMSFRISTEEALRNAARFLQEAGCDAVKLEGGEEVAELVAAMVDCGIPVMGHAGLLPQRVLTAGGYKVQGRGEAAGRLLADALALAQAGAFALVLECIPAELGARITAEIAIPTIGIGAGVGCSGQVQVVHDLLGLGGDFVPKHAKRYAQLGQEMRRAISEYVKEVKAGEFPDPDHSF
jgi:3-methyl-2-oxobutanoate hydroxymethyltransferase